MSVHLETPTVYRRNTGNETKFEMEGGTLGEVIDNFVKMFPETGKLLLDKDGNILPSFRVLLNGENLYPAKKETPIKDDDKVVLMMIVTGG